MNHELTRRLPTPSGGSVTVTIRSEAPINEADYLILQPTAAIEAAVVLESLGNALRPPGTPKIERTGEEARKETT
jgi:hypothetical protein